MSGNSKVTKAWGAAEVFVFATWRSFAKPFVLQLEASAQNDALEVLEALLRDLLSDAQKAAQKAHLADVVGTRFWRSHPDADYGKLNGLTRQSIQRERIEVYWDEMLRLVGSLKLALGHHAHPAGGDRRTGLVQALVKKQHSGGTTNGAL